MEWFAHNQISPSEDAGMKTQACLQQCVLCCLPGSSGARDTGSCVLLGLGHDGGLFGHWSLLLVSPHNVGFHRAWGWRAMGRFSWLGAGPQISLYLRFDNRTRPRTMCVFFPHTLCHCALKSQEITLTPFLTLQRSRHLH